MLIVRLGAMGDVIHGLHPAAALREAFPEMLLGWLVEERWAELLCTLSTPRSGPRSVQRPLVDRVHTVNTRQWRHRTFFRCNLGTNRSQPERPAGRALSSCLGPARSGALIFVGPMVGSARHLRDGPACAKTWPPCFIPAR